MKRIPKIYLSHHFRNSTLNAMLKQMEQLVFPDGVIFLDPARHKLNIKDNSDEIVRRNTDDLDNCDLACFFLDNAVTAGVVIELVIAKSQKKDILVFSTIPIYKINPYIRKMILGKTHPLWSTMNNVAGWVGKWYERS